MSVFIDDMFRYPMGQFGRMKMSHMIADTEEELHAMGRQIGLRRDWYQGDHYDVSMAVREKTIALGAIAITLKQCSAMMMLRGRGCTGKLADPAHAEELWCAQWDSFLHKVIVP